MKYLLIILLCSSCITGVNSYYNTLESKNIVILDKRLVFGFNSSDRYMLKVRESNEYKWILANKQLFETKNIGDTISSVLLFKPINQ